MQVSAPGVQDKIRETLGELAGKVKEGARVKAIGEGSLEVAAPLYLVFEVIIPVMWCDHPSVVIYSMHVMTSFL